ncbi:MAG: ElyC/SanA/YdcF family protein [Putridiphycobacter sp.]|nr:ElyC/SanA/YdcF family protein [Putridiphycobacter sp.]
MITRLVRIGLFSSMLILLTIFAISYYVSCSAKNDVYSELKHLPYNKVGLFLGTGKHLKSGTVNLYYQYRIDATIELYKAGKIDFVLVSGDNSVANYDEPTTIKHDLIAAGIPENKIVLDYAGFRTFDSVVRSKKIFGLDSVTIISQLFHNERALFLANKYNINAVAYNAKDVNIKYGFRTQMREKLARVKMMLDLLFGKEPRYLGEKVEI